LNVVEVTRRIRTAVPATAVVILSTHTDEEFVARARELGAKGYVKKQRCADDLVQAIETVAEGEDFYV
jgi:DNA-binding NarL/FixJ family response regulator